MFFASTGCPAAHVERRMRAPCPAQVKEIIYPLGATIDVGAITLGDDTMSVLEVWGAEYQENDCLLIEPADRGLLEAVAARERCGLQVRSEGEKQGFPPRRFPLCPCVPLAPRQCRRVKVLVCGGEPSMLGLSCLTSASCLRPIGNSVRLSTMTLPRVSDRGAYSTLPSVCLQCLPAKFPGNMRLCGRGGCMHR